jgi:uncharacterized protein YbjT (DUF2867 family)
MRLWPLIAQCGGGTMGDTINLNFINQSTDANNSQVIIFQKNVVNHVLRDLEPGQTRSFQLALPSGDRNVQVSIAREMPDPSRATALSLDGVDSADLVMTGSEADGYQFALRTSAQRKRIIAVAGATGAQGGGLVRAIAADPGGGFVARAITRDVHSDKAKALADLGAEVVAGNVDEPDTLLRAFDGAYGAYCVTFFWDHFSPDKEMAQARALATAARDAKLQHVIWSTLEDTRNWVPLDDDRMPTLMERYKVPHFDAKGEADAIFAELGVPVTYLLTSFYWDNFISFGMGPTRDAEGKLAITLPMGTSKLPGIAADDIGRSAYGIFKIGASLIGKRVGISGEHLSGEEMAAAFSTAVGEPVHYNAVDPAVYRGFGFPGAEDLGNMFQFKRDFETSFRGARDVEATRLLNPSLRTFGKWLEENRSRLAIPNGADGA